MSNNEVIKLLKNQIKIILNNKEKFFKVSKN